MIHPNHKINVGSFQNGSRVKNFNESLAQKPSIFISEIMASVEYNIEAGESNAEKKS